MIIVKVNFILNYYQKMICFFFESYIKGGLSQITKHYAQANNKYMTNYDKDKINEYIYYLDANNRFGNAMGR